jgi:DNA-binding CsgD family transcriptional regulator
VTSGDARRKTPPGSRGRRRIAADRRAGAVTVAFLTVRRLARHGARTDMRLANQAPIVDSSPRSTAPDDDATRPNESISVLMSSLATSYGLSERERAITRMVFLNFDVRSIAQRLELSERMVNWQLQDVFAKTGTDSNKSLIRLALHHASEAEAGDAPKRSMQRWSNVTAK